MSRTAASKARAHKNQIHCVDCSSWVSTLVKGRCPSCVMKANTCQPRLGGRRCDVHYGLPLYPRRALCIEGIEFHRREGLAVRDLEAPRTPSAASEKTKPKRARRRG